MIERFWWLLDCLGNVIVASVAILVVIYVQVNFVNFADCDGWTPASQWNPRYTFYPPIYICAKWWWEAWIWIWIREHKHFGKIIVYESIFLGRLKAILVLQISIRKHNRHFLGTHRFSLCYCIWVRNKCRKQYNLIIFLIEHANDYTLQTDISSGMEDDVFLILRTFFFMLLFW